MSEKKNLISISTHGVNRNKKMLSRIKLDVIDIHWWFPRMISSAYNAQLAISLAWNWLLFFDSWLRLLFFGWDFNSGTFLPMSNIINRSNPQNCPRASRILDEQKNVIRSIGRCTRRTWCNCVPIQTASVRSRDAENNRWVVRSNFKSVIWNNTPD